MNAIDLLKEDHDAVDLLFARCENTSPSKHEGTIRRVKAELETHAHIEEKIFYPACKAKGAKDLQDLIAESLEEHGQMKKFLKEIGRSTSTEKREAKLKVLIEDTRHHVKEEEDEMFPLVEDTFTSEDLEAMGERMEAERKKFQKAKGLSPRRTQPPKGVVATMMEKTMGVVASVTGIGSGDGAKKSETGGSAKQRGSSGGGGSQSKGSSQKRTTPATSRKRSTTASAGK